SRTDFLEGDIRVDGSLLLRARTTIVLARPAGLSRNLADRESPERHLARRSTFADPSTPRTATSMGRFSVSIYLLHRQIPGNQWRADARAGPADTTLWCRYRFESRGRGAALSGSICYVGIEEILGSTISDRLQDGDFEGYRGSSYI